MDVTDLKPCPFCGETEIWVGQDPICETPRYAWVKCHVCSASITGLDLTTVMTIWNWRVGNETAG